MLILALVPMLALPISSPAQAVDRPPDMQPYHVESENDDVRVARVVLAPGQRATAESPAGSVIVYLQQASMAACPRLTRRGRPRGQSTWRTADAPGSRRS
jgi:hypothetical protein